MGGRRAPSLAVLAGWGLCSALAASLLSRCGSSATASLVASYITSSNTGDLATFTFNGNTMTLTWVVTTPSTGLVNKTLEATASCATADSIYGSQACTVVASSCLSGAAACLSSDAPAIGGVFQTIQAPGTGLLVLPPGNGQLFVGVTAGSCAASVAGDYIGIDLGLGQFDTFSLFRVDSAFSDILKADFRTSGTANYTVANIDYDSQTGTTIQPVGLTCANGIRTFTLGGAQLSATLTENGMLVIDRPSGQGGILAFDISDAATIADLANAVLVGIEFPDNGPPMRMAISTGAAGSTSVPITQIRFDSASPPPSPPDIEVFGAATSPFTGNSPPLTVSGGTAWNPSGNALATDYPDLSHVPGLFHLPPGVGDTGNVIAAAMKVGGKVLLFGAVTNDRSAGIHGVGAVATFSAFPGTGSFIAFQQ
jgi:hypothetical protein